MFKKSLFSKLLGVYTGVLVIILILISIVLQYSFQRLYYADEFRRLENSAHELADIYLLYINEEIGLLEFQVGARTYSRSTNALVLITDLEGGIMFNSDRLISGGESHHIGKQGYLSEGYIPQLKKTIEGNVVREISTSQDSGEAALNLFIPLQEEGIVHGSVILSLPVQDITYIVSNINRLIWLVGIIGSVLTIFILSIVSKRFTTPITNLNNAALSMASGKFTKVKVNTEDEIGQLANSFNYMGEQLAKHEENSREFLSTVSHELRTPLTSTLGFIQGMIDGVIDKDEQEHYLGITVKEIKRMISLTNDLLSLERIKHGQIEIQQEHFDLIVLLNECIDQLNPLLNEKKITSSLIAPSEVSITGDRNRLKQVFMNLIDNGIRHTTTKIEVEVRLSGKTVEIEVLDDGPGISTTDAPYVFERFYKADKSRTPKGTGAGLGLAIARHLVELHQGNLELVPVDVGAKFKVTLPH